VVIWYIFPVLVFCTKKNLATLLKLPAVTVKYLQGDPFANESAIL
jgi:hypothetical protein